MASGMSALRRLRQRETRYTIIFGRSAITASPPFISPYSVQYPTAISDLFPVVSNSDPNLLDNAISSAPRMRDWMFSSVTSGFTSRKTSARTPSYVFMMPEMGSCSVRIPRFRANSTESSMLPWLEYREGIITPSTFSGPMASAAMAAVNAESMPPERPSSTFLNPVFRA